MDEGRPPEPAAEEEPIATVDGAPSGVETQTETIETEAVPLEPRGPSRGLIAIALVLVAALVVFAVVGGRIVAPSDGPPPGGEARLAVTDLGGKLYTMDPDGGSVTAYALPGIQFGFPGWSPDGSRIAVTGNDPDGNIRMYVFDTRSDPDTEPTTVYDEPDHPPFYIYWSPDGNHIAFLTTEPEGIALRLVPADGSAEATIVREGAPLYWDWVGNDHVVAHI